MLLWQMQGSLCSAEIQIYFTGEKLMNKSKHVPSYSLYHHICCKLNKTCFSYHFVSLPRQILVLILNYQTSNFEEYAL